MKVNIESTEHNDGTIDLLKRWRYAIRVCHKAHIRSAAMMNQRNRAIGIPVVILSTIVGTTVFSTLDSNPETWVKILVGFFSIAAAVLAGLQTFLGFSEKEEKHKAASQKYGSLRREIEEYMVLPQNDEISLEEFTTSIRTRWDAIDIDSPALSQKLYDKIAKSIMSRVPDKSSS